MFPDFPRLRTECGLLAVSGATLTDQVSHRRAKPVWKSESSGCSARLIQKVYSCFLTFDFYFILILNENEFCPDGNIIYTLTGCILQNRNIEKKKKVGLLGMKRKDER